MFLIKCVLSILFLMYMIMRFWDLFAQRRRDRIDEKMRALQELIPNCNKVDLCFLVYAWYNFESFVDYSMLIITEDLSFNWIY